jgi:hypothetical protein
MFANQHHHRDFADTRALGAESVLTLGSMSRFEAADAAEQLAQADAADTHLLRAVMCVATATLVLALVSSLA